MPNNNFPDPFITCVFCSDNKIFVNLYHNYSLTHHHFFFEIESREIIDYTSVKLDGSNNKNFPYKCFYNTEYNEVYSFYRQGQSITVPVFDKPRNQCTADDLGSNWADIPFEYQKIYDKDLGSMYLFNERALIARCSS